MSQDESFWQMRRQEIMLEPDTVFLNSGSHAPLPRRIFDRTVELRESIARNPNNFYWRVMPELLHNARHALARYINATQRNLILLGNTTHGMNIAARSLEINAGDEILMSDQEYGAMRFLWQRIAEEKGARVVCAHLPMAEDGAPETKNQLIANFASAITPKTRVLFFSHVTSPTGIVLPAQELLTLAKEKSRGGQKIWTMVDGAHAPGMIPLDMQKLDAHFYGGNVHKWLMAPTGSAFLWVNEEGRRALKPMITSWGWDYKKSDEDKDSGWGNSFWCRNFEFHGSEDRTGAMVIPDVLEYRASIGEKAIEARQGELACYTRGKLVESGLKLANPSDHSLAGYMNAFYFPKLDPFKALHWIYQNHKIETLFTFMIDAKRGDLFFLRIAPAWFNTKTEIDKLAEIIHTLPINELQMEQ